ncbi:murein biosynthesis integral membrane protein MurJ [Corynebacterium sp. ES2794-CONJ1]|uniref:murein biosynthesis integral membrane protein MurJ n=1 Tax=Corynebacterium sp. ES2794-CONJ1 TaxID=2980553 RepID=UPI0039859E6A
MPPRGGEEKAPHHTQEPRSTSLLEAERKAEYKADDAEVVRSSGSMAIATLFSRITGFLRNVIITATLGGAIASAFNTANTLPNLITEIVLGAVLTSLVVPVLVRAEKEDPDRGEAFIRRLFTLAVTLLGSITLLAVIAAPYLVQMALRSDGKVNIVQSTGFAYWLLPQIFFYGIFALLMAILNTKGIFKPGAWAPVMNNLIVLAVMGAYWFVPGELTPEQPAGAFDIHVMLLGIGTTVGVVVQALILFPYIRRTNISLKPLWGIDARLKQFGGMAAAIIFYVAISQLGYIVTTRIASVADAAAPNIYQQAWLLLQVPYGIIGVTLLTAIMPRLSRNAADGDDKAVTQDLIIGSKLTYIALIPIIVFFTIFGTWIARGLFAYGQFAGPEATILGWTLSFSAFTLLPYATVLLHLRVFYAREEAWTPTFIIAGITGTKIALSLLAPIVATSPSRVVILLGAANGFGFVAGAVIGAFLLRRKLGHLGTRDIIRTCAWALAASSLGGLIAFALSQAIDLAAGQLFDALGSVGYLVQLTIAGIVFLAMTGLVLSRSQLPEVKKLAQLLARIPGVNRIIQPSEPAKISHLSAQELKVEQPNYIDDTFNATPVPPPMSAGIVRGPRLVPGAEVSDGSFRLLVDHGSAPGVRFWRAMEKRTGREVSLTFVDTSGLTPMAPLSPAAAADAADRVKVRTLALAGLKSDSIAKNIEVRSYRNGCLIIADWVHGTPLAKLASDPYQQDPQAVVFALAPLVAAAGKKTLGLDNRARIRVNTDGVAVLAFPAVLADATHEQDLKSLRTALGILINDEAPSDIRELLEGDLEEMPGAYEKYLKKLSEPTEPGDTQTLQVTAQKAPREIKSPVGGFGRKGYGRGATTAVLVGATSMVVLAAIITAYITSVLNSGNEQAPIKAEELAPISSEIAKPSLILAVESAYPWRDSNATASFAADGNPETIWKAQADEAVIINLAAASEINRLVVNSPTPGFRLQVFGVRDNNPIGAQTNLNDLLARNILAELSVDKTRASVDIDSSTHIKQLLVLVSSIKGEAEGVEIKELQVVGMP